MDLIIVPDPEEAEAAELYVEGTVGGKPYRFLLDTGAARSRVEWDDYTAGFASAEKNDSSGVFARSSEDIITIPDITVGPIAVKNFTLVRLAEPSSGRGNLIGMDLLKDFSCHFLFDQNRVVVDERDATYLLQDLYLGPRFHPYVDVEFVTANGNAVWDTGASITIADMSFIRQHPAAFQEVGESSGTDSTGASMDTPMYVLSGATIGGYAFPPHRVAGVDLSQVNATLERPMDLILGYSTLSKANWLFDFPRRKWAITKWLGS